MEPTRINKYLSEKGICSRREADRLIEAGQITVDGAIATTGMKVTDEQNVCVKGKQVSAGKIREVLIAVHKPVGVISTTDRREKANIVDYVGYPMRIYPIGRLDKDSEGLIMMTNNGDLVNRIMKACYYHEKEYLVTVNKPISDAALDKMRAGVRIQKIENGKVLLDEVTRPCTIEKLGKQSFRIVITQGLNRQIRRMCEVLGYKVTKLKRIRVMNVELKGLPVGHYREVAGEEYKELMRQLYGDEGFNRYLEEHKND